MKKKVKFSLRMRFHYWWCDRFNIVSFNDFVSLGDEISQRFKLQDIGWDRQNEFNKLVGGVLGLDVVADKRRDDENRERGFIQ